jgi:hypothetical protein
VSVSVQETMLSVFGLGQSASGRTDPGHSMTHAPWECVTATFEEPNSGVHALYLLKKKLNMPSSSSSS